MSEESRKDSLGDVRFMTTPEKVLVRKLLQLSLTTGKYPENLDALQVQEMSDGGMGSLYFVCATKKPSNRKFGRRIAELQFKDVDNVTVLASLNVDEDGDLFELDIWKTDFKPIIQFKVT